MNLHTIVNGHWMISAEMLDIIQNIFLRHVNDDKLAKLEITKIITNEVNNEGHDFLITENGTAIINIHGVIAKKMNMLHDISGGASAELIQNQLQSAIGSHEVKAIILDIDSPGGTVDGSFELADFIFKSRDKKPLMAHSDGMMTSAAFLFGAATSKIITSSQLVQVGGIGVIAKHVDISKAEENSGIKTTILHSGKFKAVGHQHAPLSLDDRAMLQDKLDFMYTHFVTTIAKFRNVSVETAATDMAEGRTFMGDKAIKAGLVDEISTLDDLILSMPNQINSSIKNDFHLNNLKEVQDMKIENVQDLKKEYPALVKTLSEEISAESVVDFKKSSEYVALEEKANSASEAESTMNSQVNAKIKAELEDTQAQLAKFDRKFFALQLSANKNKSDKIFADMLGKSDYSEFVQNKILQKKPDFEKHLNEEGTLKIDSYTESCKTEIDSWIGIDGNEDQTVGNEGEKDVIDSKSDKTEVSAYSAEDKDKF